MENGASEMLLLIIAAVLFVAHWDKLKSLFLLIF